MLGFNKYMQPKKKYVLLKVRIFAGILRKQDFTENNFTFSCSFAKVNFFEKSFCKVVQHKKSQLGQFFWIIAINLSSNQTQTFLFVNS